MAGPTTPPTFSKWREASKIWINLLFSPTTILYFLMAADSALLGPNLTLIAQEFGFDDSTRDVLLAGRMNLVFYACGMPTALVAACLAKSSNRSQSNIVIGSAAVAQLSCICVWFLPIGPKSYYMLLFFRGMCGAAVGCAGAVGTALMSDTCEDCVLAVAASTGGVVSALGVAAGQAVAGYNGPSKGWRYPFLLFGMIGLMVALSTFGAYNCRLNPPPVSSKEETFENTNKTVKGISQSPRDGLSSISSAREALPGCCQVVCCSPTIILFLVTGLLVGMPNSVLENYWTDYYALLFFTERTAKSDGNYDMKWDVAVSLATDITVGMQVGRAMGQVMGGLVGLALWSESDQRKAPHRRQRSISGWKFPVAILIILVYITLPFPFLYTMLYAPIGKKNYWTQYWFTNFIGGVLNGFNEPLSKAFLLSTEPAMSWVVASLLTLTSLTGKAAGPTWVAALADHRGRLVAFFYSFITWIVVGLLLFGLCCSNLNSEKYSEERDEEVKAEGRKGAKRQGRAQRPEKRADDNRGDFQKLEDHDLDAPI